MQVLGWTSLLRPGKEMLGGCSSGRSMCCGTAPLRRCISQAEAQQLLAEEELEEVQVALTYDPACEFWGLSVTAWSCCWGHACCCGGCQDALLSIPLHCIRTLSRAPHAPPCCTPRTAFRLAETAAAQQRAHRAPGSGQASGLGTGPAGSPDPALMLKCLRRPLSLPYRQRFFPPQCTSAVDFEAVFPFNGRLRRGGGVHGEEDKDEL